MIDLAARLYCLLVRLPSAAIGYWLIQIRIHWCGLEQRSARARRLYTGIIIGKELPFFPFLPLLPPPVHPSERALALFAFPLSLPPPSSSSPMSMSSRLVHRMTTVVCRSSVLCAIAVSRSQQSIVCVWTAAVIDFWLSHSFFQTKRRRQEHFFPSREGERGTEGERDRGKLGGGGGDSCPTHKINVCLTGPLPASLPRPPSPSCCRLGPWRGFSLLPSRGRVGQHRWA